MQRKESKKKNDKAKTFRMSWGDGLWADVEGASETDVRSRLGGFFDGLGETCQPSKVKKVKRWLSTV